MNGRLVPRLAVPPTVARLSRGVSTLAPVARCFLVLALAGCSDLGQPVVLQPRAEFSAAALDFGTVALLDSSSRAVVVRNAGNADLSGSVTVSCPEFVIVRGGGSFVLSPGATLEVVVRFRPTREGAYSCTLDFGARGAQVGLRAGSILQDPGARCVVSVDSISFSTVAAGQSLSRRFKAFNTGTASLRTNIVTTCPEFAVVSGGGILVLAPGDSVTVTLLFSPTSGGPRSCRVEIGAGCPTIALEGYGTTVSFGREVQAVFDRHCIRCHQDPNAYLASPDLQSYASYANLVGVASRHGVLRVKPFEPDSSVLYDQVTGGGRYGPPMPGFGPLVSRPQREQIRTWILEGARNN